MNSVLLFQFFVGQVFRRSGHNSYTDIRVSLSDSTVKNDLYIRLFLFHT